MQGVSETILVSQVISTEFTKQEQLFAIAANHLLLASRAIVIVRIKTTDQTCQ